MSVLDVLLEGFDEAAHPRGFGGKWIKSSLTGGLTHRAAELHLGGASMRLGHGKMIDDNAVRGHLKTVRDNVARGSVAHKQLNYALQLFNAGGSRDHNGIKSAIAAARDAIAADNGPPASSRERGAAEVDAHMQAFKRGEVQRPRVRGDGRSGPIAPSGPAFDPVTSLGREGQAARERGASSATAEHADTRDKLANLPRGQRYGLHGPQGQVGHVERTAEGWHVVGSSGEPTSHKTPSSAAGAAMRIQRQAASSPHNADVMARNYRGGREVERMNARQSQRAKVETVRARRLAARDALAIPRVREAQPMVLGALLEGR